MFAFWLRYILGDDLYHTSCFFVAFRTNPSPAFAFSIFCMFSSLFSFKVGHLAASKTQQVRTRQHQSHCNFWFKAKANIKDFIRQYSSSNSHFNFRLPRYLSKLLMKCHPSTSRNDDRILIYLVMWRHRFHGDKELHYSTIERKIFPYTCRTRPNGMVRQKRCNCMCNLNSSSKLYPVHKAISCT